MAKGLDCKSVVIRSLEHHAGDRTFGLVSSPLLREKTLGVWLGTSHLASASINRSRELAARRLVRAGVSNPRPGTACGLS
ncbi:hypothetical protein TNCV_568981 [Trichonephila clavipes]|nr:hypothetical protein TNCV_568981 [Trichonephila clavipes]